MLRWSRGGKKGELRRRLTGGAIIIEEGVLWDLAAGQLRGCKKLKLREMVWTETEGRVSVRVTLRGEEPGEIWLQARNEALKQDIEAHCAVKVAEARFRLEEAKRS
jgi:hypothetical protein